MNKLNSYLGIIGVSIVIAACSTQAADKTDTSVPSQKLPVDARIVRASLLVQAETVAGSVLANREVTIASEVSKKIRSIHFKEGRFVSKGQLLYKLDDNDIRARVKQVQAELALAKLSESRLSQLLKSESVRQEEYDVAQTKLQSLQAADELLQTELEKTNITAPFSGIVGITKVEVGSLVSPGQSLVTLQEQENVKIQFTVAEKYLQHVKVGKQIKFSVSGEPERLTARISATESGVDNQSRTITVHAISTNASGKIRPGMSSTVYFSIVAEGATGFTLPTESLIPGAQGYSVFTVKSGVAKMTPVTIGNRTESEALITAGLSDGDTVMVSNTLRSGDGTPVQVVSIK
jgi:membrane fusion protein, multidrug efflux system